MRSLRLAGALAFAVGALALSGGDARAADCIPGAQVQCACVGGGTSIQVCSADGTHLEACQCGLAVAPALAAGAHAEAPAEPPRRSRGLFVGGLVLDILGGVLLLGGGIAVAASDGCKHDEGRTECGVGGTAIVLGVLSLGGGIPMTILGARRDAPQGAGARPGTWWFPTNVALTKRGVALSWSF
jgi:hypothetical protein